MVDSAFGVINPATPGFHIFRVEKLKIVEVTRKSYGRFFDGDAYIIYSASPYGQMGGPNFKGKLQTNDRLEQHIHFWVGEEASQDEITVAAYKTVELDDFLGGGPVQHREVQGYESKRFLSYFKEGMRILHGGISSGLNVVAHEKDPKLFIVKGKRQPIVRQLATISWNEFNNGDVFVLDAVSHIFVWNGKNSNRLERIQGSKLGIKLREEHANSVIVHVEDGAEEGSLVGEERSVFEKFLPIDSKQVRVAVEDEDDKQDFATRNLIKLYQCSDEDGRLRITEVKNGPLEQSDLNSKDTFIIDNGSYGIWVWVGKKASPAERKEAIRNAQGFLKKKGANSFTPVTRVIDGGEPIEFRCLFKTWRERDATLGLAGKRKSSAVAPQFNANLLHERQQVAPESGMVDDGKGAKEIFRIHKFGLEQVEEKDYGKFYSGDCYIVLYAYNDGVRDRYILYYWLGSHSSLDERGTAALKTIELDDKLKGAAVQVRVVQGKEPVHFLSIFAGRLIIFQGGRASTFDGQDGKDVEVGSKFLLQVHGRTPYSTYAVQVPVSSSSLNTNDCFVLVSDEDVLVWLGRGSTGDEKEMAKIIARKIAKERKEGKKVDDEFLTEIYLEGQEKSEFWSAIGGKGPYTDICEFKVNSSADFVPRLFHGSNASGFFKMEEILNFGQIDLVPEDVMVLDVGDTVFIWLGVDSNAKERRDAMTTAKDYLLSDPSGRSPDIPIVVVKQGHEPPNFTGFFGAWDPELLKQTFDLKNNEFNGVSSLTLSGSESNVLEYREHYTVEQLKSKNLPEQVDLLKKEKYLNDNDFSSVFGMNRESFEALPAWKRDNLKKNAGLF